MTKKGKKIAPFEIKEAIAVCSKQIVFRTPQAVLAEM
jgi:hypothetical protein